MLKLARKLFMTLVVRLISCGAPGCCPAIPPVPPKVTCPLPPRPVPPVLSPGSQDGLVTITPTEAVAIGLYEIRERAWDDLAAACLGVPPSPPISTPRSAP